MARPDHIENSQDNMVNNISDEIPSIKDIECLVQTSCTKENILSTNDVDTNIQSLLKNKRERVKLAIAMISSYLNNKHILAICEGSTIWVSNHSMSKTFPHLSKEEAYNQTLTIINSNFGFNAKWSHADNDFSYINCKHIFKSLS